jgi:hypothetical protein
MSHSAPPLQFHYTTAPFGFLESSMSRSDFPGSSNSYTVPLKQVPIMHSISHTAPFRTEVLSLCFHRKARNLILLESTVTLIHLTVHINICFTNRQKTLYQVGTYLNFCPETIPTFPLTGLELWMFQKRNLCRWMLFGFSFHWRYFSVFKVPTFCASLISSDCRTLWQFHEHLPRCWNDLIDVFCLSERHFV